MKKNYKFLKIKGKNPDFWSLFHERNESVFLSRLKESKFLENPSFLTPKTSALLIYSYSKKVSQLPDQITKEKFLKIYDFHKNSMNQQDFVNVSWAFAKIASENINLFDELERKVLNNNTPFNIREEITIIHSFAKANKGSEQFWAFQELFLEKNLKNLEEKELSIAIWALSKRNSLKNLELWKNLEARILTMNLKDIEYITSLIYSFGKAGQGSKELFHEFENLVSLNLQNIKPRYFANICWAFAKASKSLENPLISQYLEKWVFSELQKGPSRDLYNVLWAYNRMNKSDIDNTTLFWDQVFRGFEDKEALIFTMNSQDLMNFAWILKQRKDPGDFLKLWVNLRKRFSRYLEEALKEIQSGKTENRDFRIKAHECFYLGNGGFELWREIGERTYNEYLDFIEKNKEKNEEIKENIKEIAILALKMDRPPQSQIYKDLLNKISAIK